MPLQPLRPNPVPTEAQLWAEIELQDPTQFGSLTENEKREFALFSWILDETKKNPDSFMMHHAPPPEIYEPYRASDLWKIIKRKVIGSAKGKCAGCIKKATLVHHRDYRPSVMDGSDSGPLVALCHPCHRKVHFRFHIKRFNWHEAEAELFRLVSVEDDRLNKICSEIELD